MPCIQTKGVVPAVGANLEEFGVKFFHGLYFALLWWQRRRTCEPPLLPAPLRILVATTSYFCMYIFFFLIFDKSTWRNVRIKKDWKLGDQIYFVASKEGPICHCCVANVQSRDGGPIPFALASHVASCLDSPGISWLHVVSPTPLLGCFFFLSLIYRINYGNKKLGIRWVFPL